MSASRVRVFAASCNGHPASVTTGTAAALISYVHDGRAEPQTSRSMQGMCWGGRSACVHYSSRVTRDRCSRPRHRRLDNRLQVAVGWISARRAP